MRRVLIPPEAVQGRRVTIDNPSTLHHLRHVLRLKAGDRLECFDGCGRVYRGSIIRSTRREFLIESERESTASVPLLRITLAQSLIRPERFEWILQKATELGAERILPTMTSRTTVRLSQGQGRLRIARWRRIVEAAATQCGRATLPLLEDPQPFERVLGHLGGQEGLLLTLTEDGASLAEWLRWLQPPAAVMVLIGPEGDFSPEEVARARRHGAHPVRLGSSILRSETAALATLAILQHTVGVL